jgi:pyruvate-formate lyase-activating enzyme
VTLKGLHILLTYQCTYECDHCFVFGGPEQKGTMTLAKIGQVLEQAQDLGTVEWIYFEGGEPFLFYPVLLAGVKASAARGFQVGLVTNGYWATGFEDALEYLRPFVGRIQDLSVSSDLYHGQEVISPESEIAVRAARKLDIPAGIITVAQPGERDVPESLGQIPVGVSSVMFRGRAAVELSHRVEPQPWREFTRCPHEDLLEPERLHLDPMGNLHVCQGISIGNLFEQPLRDICESYDPEADPVIGPILDGGPARLAEKHRCNAKDKYADACHLCFETRSALRDRFPQILTPAQMYGE